MVKKPPKFRSEGGVSRIDPARLDGVDPLGRKMIQGVSEAEVHAEVGKFNHSGNGVHMWRAYALARNAGLPIRDEVLAYLDTCADAATRGDSPQAMAIGMLLSNGKGGARAQKAALATDKQHWKLIALRMAYEHCSEGERGVARAGVALKFGTTAEALRKLWERARK
jgi:hypothetical protein